MSTRTQSKLLNALIEAQGGTGENFTLKPVFDWPRAMRTLIAETTKEDVEMLLRHVPDTDHAIYFLRETKFKDPRAYEKHLQRERQAMSPARKTLLEAVAELRKPTFLEYGNLEGSATIVILENDDIINLGYTYEDPKGPQEPYFHLDGQPKGCLSDLDNWKLGAALEPEGWFDWEFSSYSEEYLRVLEVCAKHLGVTLPTKEELNRRIAPKEREHEPTGRTTITPYRKKETLKKDLQDAGISVWEAATAAKSWNRAFALLAASLEPKDLEGIEPNGWAEDTLLATLKEATKSQTIPEWGRKPESRVRAALIQAVEKRAPVYIEVPNGEAAEAYIIANRDTIITRFHGKDYASIEEMPTELLAMALDEPKIHFDKNDERLRYFNGGFDMPYEDLEKRRREDWGKAQEDYLKASVKRQGQILGIFAKHLGVKLPSSADINGGAKEKGQPGIEM